MANSYVEYSSGLTATTYSIPFNYIAIADVEVKGYNGSTWTDLTVASRDNAAKTVTLSVAPSSFTKIRVWRNTGTTQLVDFQNGSRLSETDLDTAYQQGLFVAQEVSENASTEVEGIGPQGPQGIQGVAGSDGADGTSAPEAVAFQMHPSQNQSLPDATETTFEFGTASIDTNSIVDLTNNKVVITAETAGLYWLSFTARIKNSAPPRQIVYIKVNGSVVFTQEENSAAAAGTGGSQSVTASGLRSLSSGDELTYCVYHNHGSALDIEQSVHSSRAEGYRIKL